MSRLWLIETLDSLYSDHRHQMTGKMASVMIMDDHFSALIKSEIFEGEDSKIKSLNVGYKMFTFTLL